MPAADKSEECWPDGQPRMDAVPDELRHALQSVACLSGVLFLLPLGLLVSRPPSMTEACGWAGDSLDSRCAVALALLWFSLVASVAQLVMLSAASSARRFIRRLWWHLPAVVLSTLLGGAMGMHALGLHLALLRGNCEAEWHGPHIILIAAIAAGYLIFIVYAYLMRSEAKLAKSLVSPESKSGRPMSPRGKYVDGPEEQADDSHDKGEKPVALSIVPSGAECSSDGLKLFNVAPGERGERVSRDISTAVPSQINTPTPSDRADSGDSNNSSNKSDPQKPLPFSGIEGVVAEEAELEEDPPSPRLLAHQAGSSATSSVGIIPLYGSQSSSNDSRGGGCSIDPLKPALSSFATAKRDGRVSVKIDEGRRRKSGGSRRGSAGSRRCSAGSRRGSAERCKSRRGSAEDRTKDDLRPPATTPCDPTEQLSGQIEFALAERRASLSKLEGIDSQEDGTSRHTSISSSAFTDVTPCHRDNASTDSSPKKKKKGGLQPEKSKKQKEPDTPTGQEEAIFHDENPINFDCLNVAQDSDSPGSRSDSDTDSDCGSDETETWNTGASAKVEVPIWLLEKLQARGWEPPEEARADSPPNATRGAPTAKDVRSRPASPGRFASCPDLEEYEADDSPRQFKSPMVLSAGAATAPFWKIPMPTRKNTMMIHAEKGKKAMEDEDDEDEDDDEDVDDLPEMDESHESQGQYRMSLVHADGTAEDLCKERSNSSLGIGNIRGSSSSGDARRCASGPSSRISSMCSTSSVSSGGILKSSGGWNSGLTKASMKRRKISFMDQELGQSFEKYSEEKRTRRPELAGITEGEPDHGGRAFKIMNPVSWKKPTRSRANSMQVFPESQDTGGAKEEGDGDKSLAVPEHGRRSRRPSLLAIFSDDNAKSPGLYAVPKEKEAFKEETTSELVEIRRGSLVMSSSMLTDILKSKDFVGSDRLDDIQEAMAPSDSEVILPFFSQAQQHIRNCQCQVDPETGNVIHSCMTPSATQTTNSVFQSYICSEWGTRRNSADKEARRAKSRKNSAGSDESDSDADNEAGDDDVMPPPPPMEHPRPPSRKRIRNASVLAMCSVNPQPATKTEVEEGPAQENELAISFKNIKSVEDSCLSDSSPETPEKRRSTTPKGEVKAEQATGEARVESELTHKFELLEPYIMAGMLKDPECREHLLVVDVRGRDWVGGHIPSSINLRTSEVVAHPEALLTQCRQNKITHLVFTCMYSVLRARKCAVAVEKAQGDFLKVEKNGTRLRLSLLAGGMHSWVNHFMKSQTDKPPKMYLDGFDPEMWSDGGPSQGGLVHVMDALWSSGGQKALSDALTQELEQLVLMRRNSQELSRRQSHSSTRRNSEAPADDRIVDEPADEVRMEDRASPDLG